MTQAVHPFADWLPPMLVKELRQGLRTNAFVGLFTTVQVAMILVLGMRLMDDESNVSSGLDEILWLCIAVALVALIPLRGLTALSDEVSANTLELVHLTNLGTWRIVWGKWVALAGQTLLMIIAVLPYFMLRYFFGSVEIITDLKVLGWMSLISLSLTTLCIAISTANGWTKLIVLGAAAFPTTAFTIAFVERGAVSFSGGGVSTLAFLIPLLLSIPFLLMLACKRAAGQSESYSHGLRLVALAGVGAGFALAHGKTGDGFWSAVVMSLPLLLWSSMEALTESAPQVPTLYLSWLRRGLPGQMLSRFLSEGWGTGVLYVLLHTTVLAVFVGGSSFHPVSSGSSWASSTFFFAYLQCGFALLMPRVLIELLPSFKQRHWLYLIGFGVGVLWSIGTNMAWDDHKGPVRLAVASALCPVSSWFWLIAHDHEASRPHYVMHLMVSACVDALLLFFLLLRSRREFRTMKEMESQALALSQPAA